MRAVHRLDVAVPAGARTRVAAIACLLALLLAETGCVSFAQGLRPQGPPAESASAARLRAGPWEVGRRDLRLVDTSRPTPPNGDFGGAPTRTLQTRVWFPKDAPGDRPLVIYSHGFLSQRGEGGYLGEHLASHGYVFAAPEYPLSSWDARGGPTVHDIGQQPGDARFVIDALLGSVSEELDESSPPLPVPIDRDRIGAVGLSLGGLTTTLVAFHPTLRDPRVRVAVSIAGPLFLFTPGFSATARVPFLTIASPEDSFVDYRTNAGVLAERDPAATVLTVTGASHAGFSDVADGFMRFLPNPDNLACWYLRRSVDLQHEAEDPFSALGGPEEGIVVPETLQMPCDREPEGRAMRPQRQHVITTLAVRAFVDAALAADADQRAAARDYLERGIARDLDEVELRAPAERSPASSTGVATRP